MSGPMNVDAKNIKWQDPSKFRISLTGPGADAGGFSALDPALLSMSCTGVQLAEINTTPIEKFTAEEWRFASGRLENYQIQISFKDYDNFTLYRMWAKAIQDFLREYPDDQKINLEVETSDDFAVDGFSPIVHFKDCILIAVGGATLDNSAIASIAEFSVTLKCSYVETF